MFRVESLGEEKQIGMTLRVYPQSSNLRPQDIDHTKMYANKYDVEAPDAAKAANSTLLVNMGFRNKETVLGTYIPQRMY